MLRFTAARTAAVQFQIARRAVCGPKVPLGMVTPRSDRGRVGEAAPTPLRSEDHSSWQQPAVTPPLSMSENPASYCLHRCYSTFPATDLARKIRSRPCPIF